MRARKANIARVRELIAAPLPAIDQSMQTWRIMGCTGEKMERRSSARREEIRAPPSSGRRALVDLVALMGNAARLRARCG